MSGYPGQGYNGHESHQPPPQNYGGYPPQSYPPQPNYVGQQYPPQNQYSTPPPPGYGGQQYGGPPPPQGGYDRHQYGGQQQGYPQGQYGGPPQNQQYGGYQNQHGGQAPPPPQGMVSFGHGAPSNYGFQYSNCTGRRKALLIGINYFGQNGELRGCINDVNNVSKYLMDDFGYKKDDMVILTDDQQSAQSKPTKDNMLRAMQWLVQGVQPNDSLFFHYSGHGGQTKDTDGDEEDGFDEVIYPVDFKQAGHIVDDQIHSIMVKPLPAGARLTAIFDSCHSGSCLDLPYIYSTQGLLKEPNLAKEAGQGLLSVLLSAGQGDYGSAASHVMGFFKKATTGNTAYEKSKATKTSPADVIMWSGSKDDQTSADATIAAQATGAMSWAFITAMKKNPKQSYVQLLNGIREVLATKYTQKPQLSCSHPLGINIPESDATSSVTTQSEVHPDNLTYRQSSTPRSSGTATPNTLVEDDYDLLFDSNAEIDHEFEKRNKSPREEERGFFAERNQSENVPQDEAMCSLLPSRSAVWLHTSTKTRLSALAAAVLIHDGVFTEKDLEVYHGQDDPEDRGPSDPISGIIAATHSTVGGVVMGVADYPIEITKMVKAEKEVAPGLAKEFALDSGKGVSRIVGTGLRIYGDDTVRKQEKVTGVASGLGAAGKGFGFGLYDGITGLVTQPVKGAQEGGVGGFFKGFGKGIGGIVCKPAAGAIGLPAYAFKGVYEEIQKARGVSGNEQLRADQVAKGREEWEACTEDERDAILGMWYQAQRVALNMFLCEEVLLVLIEYSLLLSLLMIMTHEFCILTLMISKIDRIALNNRDNYIEAILPSNFKPAFLPNVTGGFGGKKVCLSGEVLAFAGFVVAEGVGDFFAFAAVYAVVEGEGPFVGGGGGFWVWVGVWEAEGHGEGEEEGGGGCGE
ncbi:hypothetical protein G7Y89_g14794 [Cudoniella acicularis]|uniref:Peptidase C14 caspase domain-containing protein n=1 Tax=Cudoniella acicularis TaxID=354080 RepID=A0A8H4QYC0_9HELO|nr:hypothetical protein G7Y89_g14794 [Cudoniella acicularis]